jgi:hypothetical protein
MGLPGLRKLFIKLFEIYYMNLIEISGLGATFMRG